MCVIKTNHSIRHELIQLSLYFADRRSLTKLSEECEMRDMSGRSIHDSSKINIRRMTKQCSIQYHKSDTEDV